MPLHNALITRSALSLILLTLAPAANGAVIERHIDAASLRGSTIGTPTERRVAIYLPPGYEGSAKHYPVIYMLPNPIGSFRGDFDQHHADTVFDEAIASGALPACIVVAPDLNTPIGPSWYANSPVTGNWDDYVVKELVPYIDANFRTLPTSASRGITGNYIGAYGALRLGMLHPDVFGSVYGMHPVGTGSGVQAMTSRPDWDLLGHATSIDQVRNAGFSALFLSIFQAFLPDASRPPLFVDLPAAKSGDTLTIDAAQTRRLRANFFIAELVPANAEKIRTLRGLKFDWSRNDSIYDHIYSNHALTHLLNEYGIPHEAEEYNGTGDSYWSTDGRIRNEVLPFFRQHLAAH